MKKIFLFAIAAVSLTVGCQKIQNLVNPGEGLVEDDGTPVPVVFGTNVATISTKAAVESAEALLPFHVYGIDNETTSFTTADGFLVNEDISTARGTDGYTTKAYYGANGETYSFYGYYVGNLTHTPTYSDNVITIPVTITGQEDLMIGLTDKNEDLTNRTDKTKTLTENDLYSAKSARGTVKPNLVFDHKLVRFDFKFTDGSNLTGDAEKSVWIEKVEVTSNTTGNLVITHDAKEPKDTLIVNGTAGTLTLGSTKPTDETQATGWTPLVQFGADATDAPADGAAHGTIMVMPIPEAAEGEPATEQKYDLKLYLNQTGATAAVAQELTLAMSDDSKFVAGKKYTVNITVYGLEAVIVDVTVNEWSDGGSFTYDPDNAGGPTFNPVS